VPPAVVKSLKDLIYWQYAKIILSQQVSARRTMVFVMNKFKQLNKGSIS